MKTPRISLQNQDTGTYDQYTYGHAVRQLNAARGGREGNNAFLADSDGADRIIRKVVAATWPPFPPLAYTHGYSNINVQNAVEVALTTPGVTVATLQVLWQELEIFQYSAPECRFPLLLTLRPPFKLTLLPLQTWIWLFGLETVKLLVGS